MKNVFLSFYLSIFLSFYLNIVCKNIVCELGLTLKGFCQANNKQKGHIKKGTLVLLRLEPNFTELF